MQNFIDLFLNVWNQGLLGISISQIIISLIILIIAFIMRGIVSNIVINWLERLTARTESKLDDIVLDSLRKPIGYIPITIGLYLITIYLPLSGLIDVIATNLVQSSVVFTIFSVLANAVEPLFKFLSKNSWLTSAMSSWLEKSLKVLIWIIGLAVILDIFGIQIGPLIAGLGLFSVAIALGAQDLFKNLIAGMLIIGENRFQPGDRIQVIGQFHGIVETIGFRSTNVRLFDTSLMIIPNKDLSDVSVINHKQLKFRRIKWAINLVYGTSSEAIIKICSDIERVINDTSLGFEINPGQESFAKATEFGASSIDLEVLCYTGINSYTEFSEIKQNLLIEIKKIVLNHGSDFAFPSRSVYIESSPTE